MVHANSGQFSVIIPTLQFADGLDGLVRQCAAHPLVVEVLVINNASSPLRWESNKVRVLQQSENIYVNPAWNLGAREARGEFLAIINDDVRFDDAAFSVALRGLRWFGIVGPAASCFSLSTGKRTALCLPTRISATWSGLGTFMCLRRSNYVPIPEEMLIWGGDDWLLKQQSRPPGAIHGVWFKTQMGTTSRSPMAQAMWSVEQERALRHLTPLHGIHWWHRPWGILEVPTVRRLLRKIYKNFLSKR